MYSRFMFRKDDNATQLRQSHITTHLLSAYANLCSSTAHSQRAGPPCSTLHSSRQIHTTTSLRRSQIHTTTTTTTARMQSHRTPTRRRRKQRPQTDHPRPHNRHHRAPHPHMRCDIKVCNIFYPPAPILICLGGENCGCGYVCHVEQRTQVQRVGAGPGARGGAGGGGAGEGVAGGEGGGGRGRPNRKVERK